MPKVEIVRLGARHDRKPLGEVGEVVEVSDQKAAAMERYGLAKPVEDAPEVEAENPAENRERATNSNAENRETRSANK